MKTATKFFCLLVALFLCCGTAFAQVADFTADKIAGCDPLVVSFTNKSSGATTYSWDFGDFTSSSVKDPSKVFSGSGTYIVKLTAKNSSGSSSVKTMSITVYPNPTVSYTASPLTICPCSEVSFTNTSAPNAPGGYSSVWSFGDGDIDSKNNTTHVYCRPGKYNIALKVTNSFGCVGSRVDTDKIQVAEKPLATISASKVSLCKYPDTVTFTASVTKGTPGYTYSWDFGAAGTSTAASPKIVYTAVGSYSVRLIVTDANGCKDTVDKPNYIRVDSMHSDFKVPAFSCAGEGLIRFDNISTPSPLSTSWSCSDGVTGGSLNFQRNFWKGGTFTLTMIDNFGPGCLDTMVKTYTVHPKPVPVFSYWPIYPCPAPATIHFTSHSRGADSLYWIFGDGTTSRATNPDHIYTKDSVFTVWLIAKSDKGCLDTFRVRDTTFDFPGGYPGYFYNAKNSPMIVRVFGATLEAAAQPSRHCVPDTVNFGARITTNTRLPSATDTALKPRCEIIRGYSRPYWYCSSLPTPDPYPDDFYDAPDPRDPSYLYPYPIRTYQWDFGDGSALSTAANPTHIYTAEGRYRVILKVTTDSCSFVDTIYTEVGEKPTANFSISPDTICKGDLITGTRTYGRAQKYIWEWGDGKVDEDTAISLIHRYTVAGSRWVTLTAVRYGCADTMSQWLVINPPSSRFGFKYFCDSPRKVQFLDSSYRANKWFWDFGDGFGSTLKNPIHTYADTGMYKVRLITQNDSFSCVDTSEQYVHLYYPTVDFSMNSGCKGDTSFITWTQPSWMSYHIWATSASVDYDTSRKKDYVIFPDTGYYSLKIYFKTNHQCNDSFSKKDLVKIAKPMMRVVATPLVSCFPTTITVYDSSKNVQGVKNVRRTWYWGDFTSTTDTAIKATKTFAAPGKYNLRVVTTDAWGCKDSTDVSIEQRKPQADFVYNIDTYACIGQKIDFRSVSTGASLSYRWDFGDGGSSTAEKPSHSYTAVGAYTVKLVVTDETGCKDSIVKLNYVKLTRPRAAFTMKDSTALCPPLFVSLTNTSANAIRYAWDFDGAGTSTADNPTAPYISPGVYTIRLIAFDSHGCPDTAYHKARLAGYDGAVSYTPLSGCAPLEVNFTADAFAATEFVWDFADGVTKVTSGVYTTTHVYNKPGAYLPRLVLSDGKGCSSASRGKDTIKVDGVEAKIDMSPACINTPITFTNASKGYFSGITTTEWIWEDGTKVLTPSFTKTFTEAGTHTLRLIAANAGGCRDTVEISFMVRDLPMIKAMDTVICRGDQAALSASGGLSYQWVPDPTLSCSDCASPLTSSTSPKKYVVRGTDLYGCTNVDTLDLGIKTKTTLIVKKDEEVCAQTPILLVARGAQQYTWSPERFLDSPYIATPLAKADTTITYRIIGTEGSCIPDTAYLKLSVYPLPGTEAGADQKVLAGTEVQLNGSSVYGKTYSWTPLDLLSCADCAVTTARPVTTTLYVLTATTEHGCVDSDSVQIIVFCDQSQLFLPNTFTPNNDGKNDYFYPQGQGIGAIKSFIVFNRWGQKVFERHGMEANVPQQGWDGTVNGVAVGPDTYVYTMEATCDNGETVFWKGDVTLIK